MKTLFILSTLFILLLSCTKEQPLAPDNLFIDMSQAGLKDTVIFTDMKTGEQVLFAKQNGNNQSAFVKKNNLFSIEWKTEVLEASSCSAGIWDGSKFVVGIYCNPTGKRYVKADSIAVVENYSFDSACR